MATHVPLVKNLVTPEHLYFGAPGDFSVLEAHKSLPKKFLRPAFHADVAADLRAKDTSSMGKGAFIEYPTHHQGARYNFLQWKGVGTDLMNMYLSEDEERLGAKIYYPLGETYSFSPLLFLVAKKRYILRFRGGAFYQDLKEEARETARFATLGIRTPLLMATMKYSRSFSILNSLPVPDNNDPESISGETLREFISDRRDFIDSRLYKNFRKAGEMSSEYHSAILGQNIRAFKNVWRTEDVEKILLRKYYPHKEAHLSHILHTSARILGADSPAPKERGKGFTLRFAELLGSQAGIMMEKKLFHHGLTLHKQDVTLAAEICDVDYGTNKNEITFLDLATQILFLGVHVSIIAEACNYLGEHADEKAAIETYVKACHTELSKENRARIHKLLATAKNFTDISRLANGDPLHTKLFKADQPALEAVAQAMRRS